MKMHADEVHVDEALVRALLVEQFPEWATLPIARISHYGTDNAVFRLGDDLVVRLPRIAWAVGEAEHDADWLHRLAPLLPVDTPTVAAVGAPGGGYGWSWGVYRRIEGEHPRLGDVPEPEAFARDLGRFVRALHAVELPGGREARRGAPLRTFDAQTREAIAHLRGEADVEAVEAAWDEALAAPEWTGPPVWVHGDLKPGNLLLRGGRLVAVIDWGGLGVGDPACDLLPAWEAVPRAARDVFRAEAGVDDATWARGRGWAVATASWALPYYRDTNPEITAEARHKLREVL